MQVTISRDQLDSDGRFDPLTNFGRGLTSAYRVKALKSHS